MIQPPMSQTIQVESPVKDDNGEYIMDKYGRKQTDTETTKARVQYKTKLMTNEKGESYQIDLEIDLPPECNPETGAKINGKDAQGNTFSGTVKVKEDIINLFGDKVHYRTVFINGD